MKVRRRLHSKSKGKTCAWAQRDFKGDRFSWDWHWNVDLFLLIAAAAEGFHAPAGLCRRPSEHTQTQHSVSVWRMEHSKEWRRQAVRSWCMTVSVFAADSDSFCALSPSRSGFAHLLSLFPPVAFISSRQMCFCVKSSCTVGVWRSGVPLALTLFLIAANTHPSLSLSRL